MTTDSTSALKNAAQQFGLSLSDDDTARMFEYLRLLREWSRVYNLTSVIDPAQQITHHLLDSLSISKWLKGERIADIGSGAGLPGIPLAIADPGRHFTLVEATAKKTRFIRHAVRALALENIEVITSRAEDYRPITAFDTVVARALAALPRIVKLGGHLVAADGILLAMKGRDPVAETRDLIEPWGVADIHRLEVPGLGAERHLVVLTRN